MKKFFVIVVLIVIIVIAFFAWQTHNQQVMTSRFEKYIQKYETGEFRVEYSFSNYSKIDGLKEWSLVANHKSGKKSLLTKYSENEMIFGLFDGKYTTGCMYISNDWNCGPEFLLVPYDIAPTMSETETEYLSSSNTKTIAGEKSECFNFVSAYGDKGRFCFSKNGAISEIYLSSGTGDAWTKTIATKISHKADETALRIPS